MRKRFKEHPVIGTTVVFGVVGMILAIVAVVCAYDEMSFIEIIMSTWMLGFLFIGLMMLYPFGLTIINIFSLFYYKEKWEKTARRFQWVTILWGAFLTICYSGISEINFSADWWEQLSGTMLHTPVATEALPTICVLGIVAVLGYSILSLIPLKKMPPLVIVCSIAAMYIGIIGCAVWMIQLGVDLFFLLLPGNFIIICIRTMIAKIKEWNTMDKVERHYKNPLLEKCNGFMLKAERWPWLALLLMWPLMGMIISLLVLFGQEPDAVVKAWTETADWNLSVREAPQNLAVDGHYLCTVAAGGHKAIVKPMRMGERHGYEVIVNRQLCVANAFEQILEEKTPFLHRHIRHFYDTYGFPIAKLIHSPYIADFVYFIMKPLEWLFLIVLYFCDVNPENRIAVQYMPTACWKTEK